jgi:Isochorismatase family
MAVAAADKRSLLLIVDMLSDYSFPDAKQLLENAERPARHIRQARDAADTAGVRVVYANDFHGLWSCSREEVCERALNGRRPDLVTPLLPRPGDAFMHKGQHSAFYGTPLAHLLHEEQIEEVVLAGQVTEQCILLYGPRRPRSPLRNHRASRCGDCARPGARRGRHEDDESQYECAGPHHAPVGKRDPLSPGWRPAARVGAGIQPAEEGNTWQN